MIRFGRIRVWILAIMAIVVTGTLYIPILWRARATYNACMNWLRPYEATFAAVAALEDPADPGQIRAQIHTALNLLTPCRGLLGGIEPGLRQSGNARTPLYGAVKSLTVAQINATRYAHMPDPEAQRLILESLRVNAGILVDCLRRKPAR